MESAIKGFEKELNMSDGIVTRDVAKLANAF